MGGGGARKMQGNFLVFAHASPRACPRRASLVVRIQFKIHSNFVQYTPQRLMPIPFEVLAFDVCDRGGEIRKTGAVYKRAKRDLEGRG